MVHNVQIMLKQNLNYDLNNYAYILDKVPSPGARPRYGFTYDDISIHKDREYWIAGNSLKVIDLVKIGVKYHIALFLCFLGEDT